MIAFFTERIFAIPSGDPNLPNGILFGGGYQALHQFGVELFGIIVVLAFVFIISYISLMIISKSMHGIININLDVDSKKQ